MLNTINFIKSFVSALLELHGFLLVLYVNHKDFLLLWWCNVLFEYVYVLAQCVLNESLCFLLVAQNHHHRIPELNAVEFLLPQLNLLLHIRRYEVGGPPSPLIIELLLLLHLLRSAQAENVCDALDSPGPTPTCTCVVKVVLGVTTSRWGEVLLHRELVEASCGVGMWF